MFGNKHKPELFEKDPVDFSYVDEEIKAMYQKYIQIKKIQKPIKEQTLSKVDYCHVKVNITYMDDEEVESIFEGQPSMKIFRLPAEKYFELTREQLEALQRAAKPVNPSKKD